MLRVDPPFEMSADACGAEEELGCLWLAGSGSDDDGDEGRERRSVSMTAASDAGCAAREKALSRRKEGGCEWEMQTEEKMQCKRGCRVGSAVEVGERRKERRRDQTTRTSRQADAEPCRNGGTLGGGRRQAGGHRRGHYLGVAQSIPSGGGRVKGGEVD